MKITQLCSYCLESVETTEPSAVMVDENDPSWRKQVHVAICAIPIERRAVDEGRKIAYVPDVAEAGR